MENLSSFPEGGGDIFLSLPDPKEYRLAAWVIKNQIMYPSQDNWVRHLIEREAAPREPAIPLPLQECAAAYADYALGSDLAAGMSPEEKMEFYCMHTSGAIGPVNSGDILPAA